MAASGYRAKSCPKTAARASLAKVTTQSPAVKEDKAQMKADESALKREKAQMKSDQKTLKADTKEGKMAAESKDADKVYKDKRDIKGEKKDIAGDTAGSLQMKSDKAAKECEAWVREVLSGEPGPGKYAHSCACG